MSVSRAQGRDIRKPCVLSKWLRKPRFPELLHGLLRGRLFLDCCCSDLTLVCLSLLLILGKELVEIVLCLSSLVTIWY